MSGVFVDTSALLALLVADDTNHQAAKSAFDSLSREQARLFTTSYVLVETYALLGRRHGRDAAQRFRNDFAPLLDVVWVGTELHEAGLDGCLGSPARSLSLVDAVSFAALRARGAHRAFAFDRHFATAGFELVR
ncbi:MAG: PIN domain-containing protein [Proteobacteria bacterium]|nr:PIN domain-containing protein [Pseudomonadota bacterium]